MTVAQFAYSTSPKAYGVVHRVAGVNENGYLLSFCRKRKIIDAREVVTLSDLRHRRLCALCFRERLHR